MEGNWFAIKHGVYSRCEIVFLRNVIRTGLSMRGADSSQREAEKVARDVLNAYKCGVHDGKQLIEIARS